MKRWYVLQVYTGMEEVVKKDLEKRIQEKGLGEFFGEIVIPTSEVTTMFSGEEPKREKIFPGYLLINMEMNGETYQLVLSTPRVSRFLGGDSPVPLSEKEVERIFGQIRGQVRYSSVGVPFTPGMEVQVVSGPFAGFVGTVERVDEENERLVVNVSIFGRLTPVELSFDQVRK